MSYIFGHITNLTSLHAVYFSINFYFTFLQLITVSYVPPKCYSVSFCNVTKICHRTLFRGLYSGGIQEGRGGGFLGVSTPPTKLHKEGGKNVTCMYVNAPHLVVNSYLDPPPPPLRFCIHPCRAIGTLLKKGEGVVSIVRLKKKRGGGEGSSGGRAVQSNRKKVIFSPKRCPGGYQNRSDQK